MSWLGTWLGVVNDVMLQRPHTWHLYADPKRACKWSAVEGKTFVVTGPTSGIGTTTAETLALLGAKVILACRTVSRGEELVKAFEAREKKEKGKYGRGVKCEVMHLDLDSLDSVRAFASALNAREIPIHCLINNAGVFDMSGTHRFTSDGHEQHYGTNYLAPALLSLLLLPSLKRAGASLREFDEAFSYTSYGRSHDSGPARIVFVCSKLHEFSHGVDLEDANFVNRKYGARAAYAQSKLAELLFVRELERRLGVNDDGVDVNTGEKALVRSLAVHPGNIITGVVRTLPKFVQVAYKIIMSNFLLTPAEGARATLWAATRDEALVDDYGASTGIAPYFTSDCRARPPSKHARDDDAAAALWAKTLETLDLPADFDPKSIGAREEKLAKKQAAAAAKLKARQVRGS